MEHINKVKKKVVEIILFSIIFSIATIGAKNINIIFLRNLGMILLFIFALLRIYLKEKKIVVYKSYITFLWISMSFILIISNIKNIESIVDSIFIFLIIPIIYFYYLPRVFKDNYLYIIVNTIFWTECIVMILSTLELKNTEVFSGIYINPNTLGMNMCVFIVIIGIKIINSEKFSEKIYLSILYLIGIYYILISGSRTAFLTSIIVTIINFMYNFRVNKKFFMSIVAFISFTFLTIKLINSNYIENILVKFNQSGRTLLSGREIVWKGTLNDINLFGNGLEYFENKYGIGSHNTFIQIIGEYGVIFAIIFVGLLVIVYLNSYRIFKINFKYSSTPFILNTMFILISFTEGVFSIYGNIMSISWLFTLGYIINYRRNINGFSFYNYG